MMSWMNCTKNTTAKKYRKKPAKKTAKKYGGYLHRSKKQKSKGKSRKHK